MRASTLFALTIAVLLGLGVAVAARMSGVFNKPPEPVAAKKQEVQVLVAAKNLFAGDTIDASGIRVRVLKTEEADHYQAHKDDYLPAVPNAAVLRIAKSDIIADQPILRQQLEDMNKPVSLSNRLAPSMRAITLSVPRDQSAGGQIQVGEWVDVSLTTTIKDGHGKSTTRTAVIAPHVRVIAKRNTLWPVFAPLPPEKPVQFTLEVNPYRSAVIEHSKTKGYFLLAPLAQSEQKRLEGIRAAMLKGDLDPDHPIVFAKDDDEAKQEQMRVAAYSRNELVVGEADMVRIFGLTTVEPPAQKAADTTLSIQQFGGLNRYHDAVFYKGNGDRIMPARPGERAVPPAPVTAPAPSSPTVSAAPAIDFVTPAKYGDKDCPSCKAAKEARDAKKNLVGQ